MSIVNYSYELVIFILLFFYLIITILHFFSQQNQLNEKHIIRLAVKYTDGTLNTEAVPEHAQYVAQVCQHLRRYLQDAIDSIVDEHCARVHLRPSHGVPHALFNELDQQTAFCQRAAQCSVNREAVLSDINK